MNIDQNFTMVEQVKVSIMAKAMRFPTTSLYIERINASNYVRGWQAIGWTFQGDYVV